jgi:hypothetical protein
LTINFIREKCKKYILAKNELTETDKWNIFDEIFHLLQRNNLFWSNKKKSIEDILKSRKISIKIFEQTAEGSFKRSFDNLLELSRDEIREKIINEKIHFIITQSLIYSFLLKIYYAMIIGLRPIIFLTLFVMLKEQSIRIKQFFYFIYLLSFIMY